MDNLTKEHRVSFPGNRDDEHLPTRPRMRRSYDPSGSSLGQEFEGPRTCFGRTASALMAPGPLSATKPVPPCPPQPFDCAPALERATAHLSFQGRQVGTRMVTGQLARGRSSIRLSQTTSAYPSQFKLLPLPKMFLHDNLLIATRCSHLGGIFTTHFFL
jgi:hypothetical protein